MMTLCCNRQQNDNVVFNLYNLKTKKNSSRISLNIYDMKKSLKIGGTVKNFV